MNNGERFKEVIEDKSEFYDIQFSNKKLRKDSYLFTKTATSRRNLFPPNEKRGRRISSHPEQIARRISKMENITGLPVVSEGIEQDKSNCEEWYIVNSTQFLRDQHSNINEQSKIDSHESKTRKNWENEI